MAICLREAGEEDAERCAAIAVRAFREAPFFQAVSGRSGKGYPPLMTLLVRAWLGRQKGFAAEEDGTVLGFAVVSAGEDAAIRAGTCVRLGAGRVIRACGIRSLWAFLRASACFDRIWEDQSGPRRYLTMLAVDPDHQGRGIGTALLRRAVIPHLEAEGPAVLCLNTNKEKNRAFYHKNRFEEVGTVSRNVSGRPVSCWSYRMDLPQKPPVRHTGLAAVRQSSTVR